MKDFKVINAKAILPIYRMEPIRNVFPICVKIYGEKFDRASELYYNGIQVTDFLIQSPNQIVIRVPNSQIGKPFREVAAYAEVSFAQMDATVQLVLPKPIKMVEGMDRLVQNWILVFLTTPGTDIFSPSSGGGARALIGKSTTRNHAGVSTKLAFAIERAKGEILRTQATQPGLPLSERLLACNLENVEFDSTTSVLNARVSLSNMLGNQAQVNLG